MGRLRIVVTIGHERCPHEARNGRHEWYLDSALTHVFCRACGAKGDVRSEDRQRARKGGEG